MWYFDLWTTWIDWGGRQPNMSSSPSPYIIWSLSPISWYHHPACPFLQLRTTGRGREAWNMATSWQMPNFISHYRVRSYPKFLKSCCEFKPQCKCVQMWWEGSHVNIRIASLWMGAGACLVSSTSITIHKGGSPCRGWCQASHTPGKLLDTLVKPGKPLCNTR